jgi:hypothetical protein
MRRPLDSTGFRPPSGHLLGRERRTAMLAELIATIGLALSTIVAATALTVGIARANVAGGVIEHESSLFAIALLLGLLFIVIGGFSVLPGDKTHKH